MALRGDEPELMNLREWDRRARLIRENPTSRRFSASYIGSFREDHHKNYSRTNSNNISSTASSPGYSLKDEIDPSTYSFTNAIKALQAKTMYNNKEGFALNSKWNEAEKYICNPLSGEVPRECLSSKTLRARSFRSFSTISAPLPYFPNPNPLIINNKPNTSNNNIIPNVRVIHEDLYAPDPEEYYAPAPVLVRAEKKVVGQKRDVGIQSTSVDVSSGSPSPAKTPPITERSLKRHVEDHDSPVDFNLLLEAQQEVLKDVKLEEKEEEEEEKQEMIKNEEEEEKQVMSEEIEMQEKKMMKKKRGGGCFSWVRSRQRKTRKSKYIFPICVPHLVIVC